MGNGKKNGNKNHNGNSKREQAQRYEESQLKKENAQLKAELQALKEQKDGPPKNIIVELKDTSNKEELDIKKMIASKGMNIEQMRAATDGIVNIINAEKERAVAILEAEMHSPIVKMESRKETRRFILCLLFAIAGFGILGGVIFGPVHWGFIFLGAFFAFIGVSPYLEPVDVEKIEKLTQALRQGLAGYSKEVPETDEKSIVDVDNAQKSLEIAEK